MDKRERGSSIKDLKLRRERGGECSMLKRLSYIYGLETGLV